MEPALFDGDEVLVDPGATAREGDVVLARHPFQKGLVILKRVAEVEGDGRFRLAGDNPDESTDSRGLGSFSAGQILGRVTSVYSRAATSPP